jgi:3-oxoacyl-[acyl-carrier-protein] synthase II
MVKVVVTGVGLISCLGKTQATWQAISQQRSGIKIQQPFRQFPPLPLGLINSSPSLINQLTLHLIADTLQDAQLATPLPNTAVVIGSSRGCQTQWEKINAHRLTHHQPLAINYPWLETLPCQPSQLVAQYLQTNASVFAPMNACATGLAAIAQGYELIQQGLCNQVIVGAVETPITPLTIAGFSQMKVLAPTGCYPFSQHREGLVLGEGGGMLVLETETEAINRGANIYGQIAGWGMSCDAETITAPASNSDIAELMIQQCLTRSQLKPEKIDYIHAHGTATKLNDQREMKLIRNLFAHNPFVSSTKGAIGHTIGASGAISMVLSLLSLQKQLLLPNVGLKQPEFELNLVRKSENYGLNHLLNFSFGFGGQNAVIAITRYE